jgi:hypothetical protein
MATDLSSSSTVRSPGDADGFLRRAIQFPLQLRNGWLPKQFHYSFALILLSVSRLPGATLSWINPRPLRSAQAYV